MTKFDDGLVRGGVVGAANAAVVDTLRIGKFLTDFPKGPLFIAKQVGLQLSNPQLETKKLSTNNPTKGGGLLRNVGNFIINTANKIVNAVGPTRIYNLGINTIAQVPVGAFGIHFNRHGLLPVQNEQTKYLAVAQNNNNEENNRLTGLKNKFSLGVNYSPYKGKVRLKKKELKTLNVIAATFAGGIPFANSVFNDIQTSRIADYIGGPSSVYGIGRTIIPRVPERTNDSLKIEYAKNRNYNAQHIPEVKIKNTIDFGLSLLTNKETNLTNREFNLIKNNQVTISGSLLNYDVTDYNAFQLAKNKQRVSYASASMMLRNDRLYYIQASRLSTSSLSDSTFPDLKSVANERTTLNDYIASKTDISSSFNIKSHAVTASNDIELSTYTSSLLNPSNRFNLPQPTALINNLVTYNGGTWDGALTASNDLGEGNNAIANYGDIPTGSFFLNQNVVPYTTPALKKYNELRKKVDADTTTKNIVSTSKINKTAKKYVVLNRTNDTDVNDDKLALQFIPLDPFTGNDLSILKFLGYITDYSENYDSSWDPIKYAGRNENFYIFREFKRTATVGFNIPCFNSKELEQKHSDLSELASVLAGKYDSGGLLGGIITKLKVGKYINNQPGIITNLTFSPIQDSSWDLDKELAFYLKVSFGFTLIHNFLPQYEKNGFINK